MPTKQTTSSINLGESRTRRNISTDELATRLEEHLVQYRLHREEYLDRQAHQDEAYEKNLEAIAALTKATQGLVDSWVVVLSVQKFIKWLSGFAVIGGFITYLIAKAKLPLP